MSEPKDLPKAPDLPRAATPCPDPGCNGARVVVAQRIARNEGAKALVKCVGCSRLWWYWMEYERDLSEGAYLSPLPLRPPNITTTGYVEDDWLRAAHTSGPA